MNNELMTQIEALDDREYLHEWGTAKAMGDGIPVTAIKSLAAELTLANKKLAILQASNDHYTDYDTWETSLERDNRTGEISFSKTMDLYIGSEGNGSDVARKTQEQIARLTDEVEHIDNNAEAKRNLLREMGSTRPLDRRDFDIRINKKG